MMGSSMQHHEDTTSSSLSPLEVDLPLAHRAPAAPPQTNLTVERDGASRLLVHLPRPAWRHQHYQPGLWRLGIGSLLLTAALVVPAVAGALIPWPALLALPTLFVLALILSLFHHQVLILDGPRLTLQRRFLGLPVSYRAYLPQVASIQARPVPRPHIVGKVKNLPDREPCHVVELTFPGQTLRFGPLLEAEADWLAETLHQARQRARMPLAQRTPRQLEGLPEHLL